MPGRCSYMCRKTKPSPVSMLLSLRRWAWHCRVLSFTQNRTVWICLIASPNFPISMTMNREGFPWCGDMIKESQQNIWSLVSSCLIDLCQCLLWESLLWESLCNVGQQAKLLHAQTPNIFIAALQTRQWLSIHCMTEIFRSVGKNGKSTFVKYNSLWGSKLNCLPPLCQDSRVGYSVVER